MTDNREFQFTIYHNGVHFTAPVRGVEGFCWKELFLDDLVAEKFGRNPKSRPIPDPPFDFYELNDEELESYSDFPKSSSRADLTCQGARASTRSSRQSKRQSCHRSGRAQKRGRTCCRHSYGEMRLYR